jgi:PAS domain S-box-containing protein
MMKDEAKTKKQLINELNELRKSVDELKGFEEEIKQTRASHEKFAKAFLQNSIPAAITTLKEDRFVDVSNAFLNLMGWKRNEVIGRTSIELGFTEEQRVSFSNELNKRGCIENLEMKIRAKGGALRDGLFNAVMMTFNNEKYLLTVMTDITERKQAEEALRESEATLRALINAPTDSVLLLDTQGVILDLNKIAAERLGKVRDDLIGNYADNYLPEDTAKKRRSIISKIFETGREVRFEDERDGIWYDTVAYPIHDKDGAVSRLAVIARDITEHKRGEEALRESEENFRRSIDESPLGVRIVTIEGETIYANRAILDIYGYDNVDELRATPVINRYTAESYAEYLIRREKRKRGVDSPSQYAIGIIRKNGEVRDLQVFRKEILWDGKKQFQVTYNDITELKQAEEMLRKSEEKYRAVLENASDAILLGDEQGNLIEANRKAEEIFGYPREELLQMHYTQLHPIMELEKTIAAYNAIVTHGKGGLRKGVMLRKDGIVFSVDITATAVEYDGMRVLQASFRDISEHKQTEDTLERLVQERTAELSEKNKQLVEENTNRRRAEEALKKREKELEVKSRNLEEMNTALNVLLKQRENDKDELEEQVLTNVKQLVMPYIGKLKKCRIGAKEADYVSILESNLKEIVSPFSNKLSAKYVSLTPKEIQITNLIRDGKTTKEIAEILNTSPGTVEFHRNNIREKLNIKSKKANLRSYLLTF